ncbi:ADP-ribose pyrophosphatase YjhB [Commensalibacter communis]|uniref:NUDIX hydrolase n=1 Tax=Commensalibacter communis TaxID=2972786 RepID=UPI0022FF9814|nr:NUDIX domain-containing protein [Commensalibacter communis]CAI3954082.1 ADP-ribose pyrophosphatase YjhB [Commensalibacter communis]CAI3958772.1 ADP-ribose pyrophosphatase YjhB [Commensalibacter communis]
MVDYVSCALIKVGKSVLLVKRQDNNRWSFPGGHKENSESPVETAIRETKEETGITLNIPVEDSICNIWLGDKFISFVPFRLSELETVEIDTTELTDAKLFPMNDLPDDCMDTVYQVMQWNRSDEQEIARDIARGELASPQYLDGNYLFDMRLTGTGIATRNLKNDQEEITYRDPKKFLTKKFLDLCNGVRVVFDHPEKNGVDTEFLRNRQVGTVILPYVFDQEVWAIVKIASPLFSQMLMQTIYSTSPSVTNRYKNNPVYYEKNKRALYENSPYVVDHLAIVENGVWDKDGKVPAGISTPLNKFIKKREKIIMSDELDKRYEELMAKADKSRKDAAAKKDSGGAFLAESKKKYEDELEFYKERVESGEVTDEDKEYLDRAKKQYEDALKSTNPEKSLEDRRKAHKDSCAAPTTVKQDATRKNDDQDRIVTCDQMEKMFTDLGNKIGEHISKALTSKETPKPNNDGEGSGDGDENKPSEDEKKNDGSEPLKQDEEPPREGKPLDEKTVAAMIDSGLMGKELSEEDREKVSDCQMQFERVYKLHNKTPPRPLPTETPELFAMRALKGVIQHSQKWNAVGMDTIRKDSKILDVAVPEVIQDAEKAATASISQAGQIRYIEERNGGSTTRTPTGDPSVFFGQFAPPDRAALIN